MIVPFTKLRPGAATPAYKTSGAAGMDLHACIEAPLNLSPHGRALVPTGIAVAIPPGFEGQIRPRSGMAWHEGVTVLNSPGTLDADFRGEIKVILINLGDDPVPVRPGDRIAQMVVCPVVAADLREVPSLDGTGRGAGGFGHTGRGDAPPIATSQAQDPGRGSWTLGDLGVVPHDCSFCPAQPADARWKAAGPAFASDRDLREVLAHYLYHRAHHMRVGAQPPCPCCGAKLRPHYKPEGAADANYLRSHPDRDAPEVALLRTELGHFLCGSLRVPDTRVSWADPPLAEIWPWLMKLYGFDELGRLTFK